MNKIVSAFFALILSCCAASAQMPGGGGAMGVPSSPPGIQTNLDAAADPAVNNDATQGYSVGSLWQNSATGRFFVARSVSAGAAKWTMMELSDHPGYIAGNWYIPSGLNGPVNAGSNVGANIIRLTPGYVKERISIGQLGFRCTTLSAGGNAQAAIYANNPATMRPTGTPLITTGNMSTAATGNINAAAVIQLEPGMYWWASNLDNATATLAGNAITNMSLGALIGSTAQGLAINSTQTFTGVTTPSTFGTWGDLTSATFTEQTVSSVPLPAFNVTSAP